MANWWITANPPRKSCVLSWPWLAWQTSWPAVCRAPASKSSLNFSNLASGRSWDAGGSPVVSIVWMVAGVAGAPGSSWWKIEVLRCNELYPGFWDANDMTWKQMKSLTWKNKCANAWRSEWTNGWINEWRNEGVKEWMSETMFQWMDDGIEEMNESTSQRMDKRMNEWTHPWWCE